MSNSKNLTQEAPRSPRHRLGNYALLARSIDKGHAAIAGNAGEYHFACPLDQMLFEFKGVKDEEVKKLLASGATDEQVVTWLNTNGASKTDEEIGAWSTGVEAIALTTIRKKRTGSSANARSWASSPRVQR